MVPELAKPKGFAVIAIILGSLGPLWHYANFSARGRLQRHICLVLPSAVHSVADDYQLSLDVDEA
jgi:hypothetical protein